MSKIMAKTQHLHAQQVTDCTESTVGYCTAHKPC